ncbi:hypothetical protein PAAG_11894 [Paracoccidioides lutzii Pb01]|uniref:Uncharacterized protein n=1 Tax=Paracoccidioides lutzii (strain ATCC MYA-826 / Pb01) TaxID=502779 RepID=A0A0A2V4Y0_PARBA|nr:hypothetical protein PAAG_11894 [Paracoccidioides lutzii Pb01]KGQ01427.1 hypothetical protein PAAG_11894 [Paracoccidioides lutzii Pb01]
MPKSEYIATTSLQAGGYVDDFEYPNHPLPRTRTAQIPSTAVRLPQLVPTVGFRAAGVRILADVPSQWSGSPKSQSLENWLEVSSM